MILNGQIHTLSIAWYHIIYTYIKWGYALSIRVRFLSYSSLLHSCLAYMYPWYCDTYSGFIRSCSTYMYTWIHIFLSYGLYLVSVSLRVRLCVCAFYWSGSSLFFQINVRSCFVRFVQRFHLGVRIVCSSFWDDMGLKLIHKTLRFVKAISSKALAMP